VSVAAVLPDIPGHSIIKELGRGGMGVVYLARQEQLKRLVALKMILSGSLAGEVEVARFRREAESAARLQHANIVAVHEIGLCNGLPYFSLEYVEGGSLADALDGKPVPPESAAQLVEVLARAVHHAHQHGIIHRDLKPANVLLSFSDASQKRSGEQRFCEASLNGCVPKITDFGLAKQLDDSSQTRSGAIVGTPSYMAPEQACGDTAAIGTASDIYALGAILYEMLSGRPPFRGTTVMETLEQVRHQEPVTLSRLQPGCPRDLETICLKCLRKEPEKRYGSAEALADDLHHFLAGEPILARPVGAAERLWKWARRRPAVAMLLATTLLTALAGFALVAWKWREADAAKQTAEKALGAEETARRDETAQRLRAVSALEESRRSQYFTNIAFAFQAWSANDIGKMEELLGACPPDLRRWEWQLGLRRCRDGLATLRPGGSPVQAVAFSPGGRRLAAGAGEPFAPDAPGTIHVWDLERGGEALLLRGHTGAVTALHFLPDGQRVVSASVGLEFLKGLKEGGRFNPRGQVILWDLKTRKPLLTLRDVYGSASLTADGERLATAALDGTIQIRNTKTGKVEQSFERLDGVVSSVVISPDGGHVAAAAGWVTPQGNFGSDVLVWDVRLKKLAFSFQMARVEVGGLAFSPDGKRLAWGGTGGRVEVRETATGRLLLPLAGHTEAVMGVAFSPDGKQLATTSNDRSAKLWDAQTGLVLATFRGHSARVGALGFDPAGWRLATGGRDGLVKVWDVLAGPTPRRLRGHTQPVRSLSFSPDGRLATCSIDKVLLWEPRSAGKPRELDCDAQRVAFSPDGRRMAAAIGWLTNAERPGVVEVWDVRQGRKLHTLTGHKLAVLHVAYSPDGKLLVSASGDPTAKPPRPGTVRVWDAATGKFFRAFEPQVGVVADLAFSADGRRLALAGTGGAVSLWDVGENREVRRLTGHRGWAHSVAFSPDGRTLVSGDFSGVLRSWEADSGRLLRTWNGHTGIIYSLAFSPDGRRLASAGVNPLAGGEEVKLWEPVTGREILTLPGRVVVAFSPDGNLLAAPGSGGLDAAAEVRVWDGTPTGEVFTLRAGAGRALCVAFSPAASADPPSPPGLPREGGSAGGKVLASGHDGGVLKLWDRQTGRELRTLTGHRAQIVDVAFSPDGKLIATAGWDREVRLWEAATGKARPDIFRHKDSVTGVAFSPDGKTLATSAGSDGVKVWRLADGKKLHQFKHGEWVWGVAWSPDGRRLASCSRDRTVMVRDLEGGSPRRLSCPATPIGVAFSHDGKRLAAAVGTGGNIVLVWDGDGSQPRSLKHSGAVAGVAFAPDGRLVSCSLDRLVHLWDVDKGTCRTFAGHADLVRKVAWSADGRSFASASVDGTVKVWDPGPAR
jgi:WD40 repeat protein/tRNA A-37 threonylcarbamoyl transferase component Bud32